jgi:hypothetical protein
MKIERIDGCGGEELKDYVLSNPRPLLYGSVPGQRAFGRETKSSSFNLVID